MGLQAKPYLQRIAALFGDDVDWERHPYSVPAVRNLESISFHPDVTFFIGENGAGKSTVLESIALALGFSMEGGTKGVQLNTAREDAPLHKALKLSKSFRTPRDGYFFRAESFHNVANYMDEMGYLQGYGGRSPILLAYPNAKILLFDGTGISEVAYEDTEHYSVTRDFLNHYPRRLEQLLTPE